MEKQNQKDPTMVMFSFVSLSKPWKNDRVLKQFKKLDREAFNDELKSGS